MRFKKYLSQLALVSLSIPAACILLPKCSPTTTTGPSAHSAAPPRAWSETQAALFDDGIDMEAMLPEAGTSFLEDPVFKKRAQQSEFLLRVRVSTVTAEGTGDKAIYHVGLHVIGDPLAGPRPPTDTFDIVVRHSSPAFGILRNFDLRLLQRSFVAQMRRFSINDEVVWHWHLTRDSSETIAAIKNALVLSEMGGR